MFGKIKDFICDDLVQETALGYAIGAVATAYGIHKIVETRRTYKAVTECDCACICDCSCEDDDVEVVDVVEEIADEEL